MKKMLNYLHRSVWTLVGVGFIAYFAIFLNKVSRYNDIVDRRSNTYTMYAFNDGFTFDNVPDRAKDAALSEFEKIRLDKNSVKLASATLLRLMEPADAATLIYYRACAALQKCTDSAQVSNYLDVLETNLPSSIRTILTQRVITDAYDYYWMSRYFSADEVLSSVPIVERFNSTTNWQLIRWLRLTGDQQCKAKIVAALPFHRIKIESLQKHLPREQMIKMADENCENAYEKYVFLSNGGLPEKEVKAYIIKHLHEVESINLFTLYDESVISKNTLIQQLNRRKTSDLIDIRFYQRDERHFATSFSDYIGIIIKSIKNKDDYFTASSFIESMSEDH